MLAAGPDLRVRLVNDAAEQLAGRSRDRLCGLPLRDVSPGGAALEALARKCAANGGARGEAEGWGVVEASPWWSGGDPQGVVLWGAGRGVTPERSDLDVLAAGLAHEVRNPLAALRGAAELMGAEAAQGLVPSKEYFELLLRESSRIDALVGRMLSLSRPPALSPTWFPVQELLHDLAMQARALAAARGARVVVDESFDPALPMVRADRARLFEALVNLAKNAVEAVRADGGRVSLEARVAAEVRRRDAAGRVEPLVRVVVRDDGPGLGAQAGRLFTPFFTTKAGGTGLGLLLARQAVEAHGGRLVLRNRAMSPGAEAEVLLPLGSAHG